MLSDASGRTLVYVGSDLSTQAQRTAVAIADLLRARSTPPRRGPRRPDCSPPSAAAARPQRSARFATAPTSSCSGPSIHGSAILGSSNASSSQRYARFRRQAGPEADLGDGRHRPGAGRRRIELSLAPADEIAALSVMRATVLGNRSASCPRHSGRGSRRRDAQGSPIRGGRTRSRAGPGTGDPLRVEGLIALAQALNGPTRAALSSLRAGKPLRSGGGAHLADRISLRGRFASGFPRYTPRRPRAATTRDRGCTRRGSAADLSGEVAASLGRVPTVAIGPRASEAPFTRGWRSIPGCRHPRRRHRVPAWTSPAPAPAWPSSVGGPRARGAPGLAVAPGRLDGSPMSAERLRITGGHVHDPANGVDGEVRDICIEDGRIVAELPDRRRRRSTRAAWSSCPAAWTSTPTSPARAATTPAGCCPKSTPPIRRPRRRCSSGEGVPRSGHRRHRAEHVHHRLPLRRPRLHHGVRRRRGAAHGAAQSHAELDDTPFVDAGFFVLMGNDEYLLRQIDAGERDRARDYAAWLLGATGGYAIKIVNPGGIEVWKAGQRNLTGLDDAARRPAGHAARDSRDARRRGQRAAAAAPGRTSTATTSASAGNVATTLATHAGAGRPARALHPPAVPRLRRQPTARAGARRAARVIEYVNAHPEVSGDVGQVMFGPATTLTADGPVEYLLHKSSGRKWVNVDIELETGCGIVPLRLQGEGGGGGAAVGGRARAVPAERAIRGAWCSRPTTRTAARSCLPGADPAADGSRVPRRAAEAGESRSCWRAARWPTASPASTR